MSKCSLVVSLRNTAEEKLDLLRNDTDGWFRLRLIKLNDDAAILVKVIGVSPEEMEQLIKAVSA